MRVYCFLLMVSAIGPFPAFGQFTREAYEEKQIDQEKANREQSWDEYRKQLAKGAVYQAEIVYRDEEDQRLYYYRVLFGPQAPRPQMFGYGVDHRGQCVPPPDPGIQRIMAVMADTPRRAGEKPPPPPLAFVTRYLDVEWEEGQQAGLRVSDLGTNMPLPANVGDVKRLYFNAWFRLTRLSNAEIKVAEPLRLDADALKKRLQELRQEALAELAKLPEEQLTQAAEIWQDSDWVKAVRQRLNAWIDRTPDEVAGKGFPNHLCHALGQAGTKADYAIFHRLTKRHRDYAPYVNYPTLLLMKRAGGGPEAKALVSDLLADPTPLQAEQKYVQLLRQFDPTIPVPTSGDDFLRTMTTVLRLKPDAFHFTLVQEQLLPIKDRFNLTRQEIQYLKDANENRSGDWIMLTKKDRDRGYQAALRWIADK